MGSTSIEWTEATWNPTTGCDRVSPGCDHCYALTMAGRLKAMGQTRYQQDGDPRTSGPGFGLTLHPDSLGIPLRRKTPTTYFVNSMSDLFHPSVTHTFIADVFAVMTLTPRHTYQVLTKRPQRMHRLLTGNYFSGLVDLAGLLQAGMPALSLPWPSENVWLGTSIESDAYTWRADHLRATPATVRFLSLEPLLGALPSLDLTGIDWVIVGAESGRGARPMDLGWVREIRDQCFERLIPFFFKQSATPGGRKIPTPELDGRTWTQIPRRSERGGVS